MYNNAALVVIQYKNLFFFYTRQPLKLPMLVITLHCPEFGVLKVGHGVERYFSHVTGHFSH